MLNKYIVVPLSIVILIMFLCINPALAQTSKPGWIPVGDIPVIGIVFYYNSQTMNLDPKISTFRVMVIYDHTTQKAQKFTYEATKFPHVKYLYSYQEYNYKNNTWRVLRVVYVSTDGKILGDETSPITEPLRPTIKDTPSDLVLKRVRSDYKF